MTKQQSSVAQMRDLLDSPGLITVPCCFDALSARLIEQAGFSAAFMSGFAVSATRLGLPDTGLISYAEMLDQGQNICSAVGIPVLGDADTGYGNPMNAKRTLHGYIRAGFAGIMIEDQKNPKRCGHTSGKEVVDRPEAVLRIRAVVQARQEAREHGDDIVIIARTDARATRGLGEAIERARLFAAEGADLCFVEAPQSIDEMRRICRETEGHQMANMLEQGLTPILLPAELEETGFKVAAYPLTLLSTAAAAMRKALAALKKGTPADETLSFAEIKQLVGFEEYEEALQKLESKTDQKDPKAK